MKKYCLAVAVALLTFACGAGDDKNEAENYPTYDTTNEVNTINDTTTSGDMRSEGELRFNIDSDGDGE